MSYQPDLFERERLVLVCGGRPEFYPWGPDDARRLRETLLRLGATAVIHGDARGVDREAGKVAEEMGLKVYRCPADWDNDEDAGRTRSLAMLDRRPVAVVAFDGGPGTRGCVAAAEARKLPIEFL